MAASRTAWGIEIGQFAVKAIQLERSGDEVRVRDFFYRKHKHVLSAPGLAESQSGGLSKAALYLEQTLSQFAVEKQPAGQSVVVNFNWNQNRGFARFAKLPPVPPKEVPSLVQFEAGQQIPFPLEDVEWGFHAFAAEDSPEVEVGIFAVQQEPLKEFLSFISEKIGVEPMAVTLSPVALYNAMAYDQDIRNSAEPMVLLDIGTTATDLVVANGSKCWMRSFPLGGHNFTEAIAARIERHGTVANPYDWAEEQKREGATSKHREDIMKAIKPVIDDLIGDVQKSIQYYENQNRGVKCKSVRGLGSTFKIPGLRVILGRQLGLEVARIDEFKRISVDGSDAAEFASNVVNYAVAYGLALQGLGRAEIDVNLMPVHSLRQRAWGAKTRWFAAAAAISVAASGLMFLQHVRANSALSDVSAIQRAEGELQKVKLSVPEAPAVGAKATNMLALVEDREVWPMLVSDAINAIAAGNDETALGDKIESLVDPKVARSQTTLRDLSGVYSVENGSRFITVTMSVEFVPANSLDRERFLSNTVCAWLKSHEKRDDAPYEIVDVDDPSATLADAKVGANGSLTESAESAAQAAAAAESGGGEAGGQQGRPGGAFSAGTGGAGGGNFGGLTGRKGVGEQINRGGGLLGGAGAGGGFSAGSTGGGEFTNPDGSAGGGFTRGAAKPEDNASKVNLDALAPIPSRPGIYPPDSTVHLGKVMFKVKIKGGVAAAEAAPAAEVQ
jgi:type IV pilus assembly protein PilM